jgi:excisionase family DNA binding protein
MVRVSVAQAAQRLGVGVARVHQRIADGSLSAERIGSQWVVEESSLTAVAESRGPGRPLSERSVWALVAVSLLDHQWVDELAPSERSRARDRLRRLLASSSSGLAPSEAQVQAVAASIRSLFRNRADQRSYRASPRDLPALRADPRIALSGLSHPRSAIASADLVEGYVSASDIDAEVEDLVLSPASSGRDANVILRVVAEHAYPAIHGDVPLLLVAADLADHRRPREETRAAELLREISQSHPELGTGSSPGHHQSPR